MAKLVNKQTLSELQGVSLPTISKLLTEGMPYVEKGGRGKGYLFDNAAVTEWRVARGRVADQPKNKESEAAAKQRKTSAEADIAEMKAAQTRGDLVPLADILKDVQNDMLKVKSRLLAIANRAAPVVVGMDEIEARECLSRLICDALDEISVVDENDALTPFDPVLHVRRKLFPKTYLHSGRFPHTLMYDVESRSMQVTFSDPKPDS